MLRRDHWLRHIEHLDPDTDYEEIYRVTVTHEFPWDMNQALSFALFRTFAVPSIGRLLDATGEFRRNTQKRYDDTALLLDELSIHGLRSVGGRRALRRINQMHRVYDISNDDLRYVLSTFVVVPKRWMDDFGWRPFTPAEVRASTRYYVELGSLMGIRDIPETFQDFARLLDDYEGEHFAFDRASKRVADSTFALMTSFYPRALARPVGAAARSLMDSPLRSAFRYPTPPTAVTSAVRGALLLRARVERLLPARSSPMHVADLRWIRSYPDGHDVDRLGTFPRSCPVQVRPTGSPAAR